MGVMIHYTDTDSMHIEADGVQRVADEFKKIYGKDMLGKGVGQFHVDFDFKSSFMREQSGLLGMANSEISAKGEIFAVESIFLGKKSYIDVIEDEDNQRAYHIRLKGIPSRCIINKCNDSYAGDPMAMFQALHNGEPVDFSLGVDGHPMFKTQKDHNIISVKLTRTLKFKS
jgi:hypothetical protein